MVAFVENKHLSLAGQPAKRRRMNNAIAVTAESIAREARCFREYGSRARSAEIDFADDLIGASFCVNNPNANSSCGCGTSFAL
jgi:hypothetical protein